MEQIANAPLSTALKRSLIGHAIVIAIATLSSMIHQQPRERIIPTLRVDLVALPDHKKDEAQALPAPEKIEPEKKTAASVTPEPTVVTPKVKVQEADVSLSKKRKKIEKSMKGAIERLRALEKLRALKGNIISKGTTTSGEAKEREEATYFDGVLQKLRDNWELPSWLQTQGLSAQVIVYLNSKGNILRIQFKRPSGNEVYDQEVRRAIQRSAPFDVPPEAVTESLSEDGVLLGFPL
jgi:outer membrane biosynthesis protein TonB